MINEQIRDREVRVVSADGEQLGVMSSRDAMKLAREAELDLVKIAPRHSRRYVRLSTTASTNTNRAAERKEAKKKQKTVEVKEVRMSPNIDANDLNTKGK